MLRQVFRISDDSVFIDGILSQNLEFDSLLDGRLIVITDGDINPENLLVFGKCDMIFYNSAWYAVDDNGRLFWWHEGLEL